MTNKSKQHFGNCDNTNHTMYNKTKIRVSLYQIDGITKSSTKSEAMAHVTDAPLPFIFFFFFFPLTMYLHTYKREEKRINFGQPTKPCVPITVGLHLRVGIFDMT